MGRAKPRNQKGETPKYSAETNDKRCEFINSDGSRCEAFRVRASTFCTMHDPETRALVLDGAQRHRDFASALDEEIKKPHDLTTNKGVVHFNSLLIQAVIHRKVKRPEANTLGYLLGIQLQAIRARNEEEEPSESIANMLGDGVSVEIRMTKEERRAFLTAGSMDKMGKLLEHVKQDGRIIDLKQNSDGTYGASVEAKPRPSRDMKMPAKVISDAMKAEGIEMTSGEVIEAFGDYLGDERDHSPETIGFEGLYEEKNAPQGAKHEFKRVSIPHGKLDGVMVMKWECVGCGVQVAKTAEYEEKICEARI